MGKPIKPTPKVLSTSSPKYTHLPKKRLHRAEGGTVPPAFPVSQTPAGGPVSAAAPAASPMTVGNPGVVPPLGGNNAPDRAVNAAAPAPRPMTTGGNAPMDRALGGRTPTMGTSTMADKARDLGMNRKLQSQVSPVQKASRPGGGIGMRAPTLGGGMPAARPDAAFAEGGKVKGGAAKKGKR